MAYPAILTDTLGNPIPQVFDGQNWRALKGDIDGQRAKLLDAQGNPISESNPMHVTSSELKTELQAMKTELEAIKAQQTDGSAKVQLSGTMMEQFGATVGERPPADSVPVGAAFVAVRTMNVWISDGSTWQEVA